MSGYVPLTMVDPCLKADKDGTMGLGFRSLVQGSICALRHLGHFFLSCLSHFAKQLGKDSENGLKRRTYSEIVQMCGHRDWLAQQLSPSCWEVPVVGVVTPICRGNCNSDSLVMTGPELCSKQRMN